MSTKPDQAQSRAEAMFKKAQSQREGEQAMAEYQSQLRATREKTARLRAQRLARDASQAKTLPASKKRAAQT